MTAGGVDFARRTSRIAARSSHGNRRTGLRAAAGVTPFESARRRIHPDCAGLPPPKARPGRRSCATSAGRMRVSRNASGRVAMNASMRASFSARNTEHVAYSRRPPRASSGHSAASRPSCSAANCAMSEARRSHLASGWRRTMPDALQGTSARMRSNARPSHHAAGSRASPATTVTAGDARRSRARLSRTRGSRAASRSSAVIATSASSRMCVVLPPGAAHASSTRMPSPQPSSGAASCAPGSCTLNAPSA